jgi:hypothetical protein
MSAIDVDRLRLIITRVITAFPERLDQSRKLERAIAVREFVTLMHGESATIARVRSLIGRTASKYDSHLKKFLTAVRAAQRRPPAPRNPPHRTGHKSLPLVAPSPAREPESPMVRRPPQITRMSLPKRITHLNPPPRRSLIPSGSRLGPASAAYSEWEEALAANQEQLRGRLSPPLRGGAPDELRDRLFPAQGATAWEIAKFRDAQRQYRQAGLR